MTPSTLHRALRPFAALVLAGAALAAQAAPFTRVDTDASHITFGYTQMNVGMEGAFTAMKATEFMFDPAAPENARVVLDVPLDSVDSGNAEADAELVRPDWLAAEKHPVARFESKAVKPLGENRYEVSGPLSIKGTTRDITFPVTFKTEGEKGVFEGSFTFQRADFGIGEGPWGDFSIVANDVTIKFHVVAGQ